MINFINPPKVLLWFPLHQVFFADIFLQYFENLTIKHIIECNHTTFYTCYVDIILIIYNHTQITSAQILPYAKIIHTNLQLKYTLETQASIKFLGILLHKFQI
jgi:hypothetical protein